jgi:hypothetical protein
MEWRATRTSDKCEGRIRCIGGVSILCWPVTPAVRPYSKLGIRDCPSSKPVWKWQSRSENHGSFGYHWLIINSFTSRSRVFHLYGDVTFTGEGLQNLGLCSTLRAFEQGGIFIVPHLLWHWTSVFPVSSEGPRHSVVSYDTRGGADDQF